MKEDLKQAIKELWNEYQAHIQEKERKASEAWQQYYKDNPGYIPLMMDGNTELRTDVGEFMKWLSSEKGE